MPDWNKTGPQNWKRDIGPFTCEVCLRNKRYVYEIKVQGHVVDKSRAGGYSKPAQARGKVETYFENIGNQIKRFMGPRTPSSPNA